MKTAKLNFQNTDHVFRIKERLTVDLTVFLRPFEVLFFVVLDDFLARLAAGLLVGVLLLSAI
ncbi:MULTISPECIES: hypothetical protein [Pseudoalteromonas]|uniref:hypothetical protein n=1 Tax=Pseudoalteromonas TaxID=53246 RepID=UPI001EF5D17F|nr:MULTISPECIES: hypothetical protein [Pseudoalteromonas]MDQ2042201.1 hypothetical protein [Pseudoalteromonas sp. 20-92]